ncbi:hypothetical protein [Streptomyces sp. NPDC003943]
MLSIRRARVPLAALASGVLVAGLVQTQSWATTPDPAPQAATASVSPAAAGPATVAPAARDQVLGKGWRESRDLAWTTTGDARGFHLLTARRQDGYTWRTTATLSEPGFDTDAWIGNACVTGSGRRAVVVYAPRTFTNDQQLMSRGGFTAIVDLPSGKVTKLDIQASLSYYNPGCGTDERAVLTQSGTDDRPGTRLVVVDAATGALAPAILSKQQLTSAVPARAGQVVAADGPHVVALDRQGRSRVIADTDAVPYRLAADRAGGVVFLDRGVGKARGTTRVKRADDPPTAQASRTVRKPAVLAEGGLTTTGLTAGAGTVYVTGDTKQTAAALPDVVRRLPGVSKQTVVTTHGDAWVTSTRWADGLDSRVRPKDAGQPRSVDIAMTVPATGRTVTFTVDPTARQSAYAADGRQPSPRLTAPRGRARKQLTGTAAHLAASDPANPVEDERTCSVPRNDPRNQAMQPKPRQVEWAVDQAITGNLNLKISRPANWKNLGMPAYQPQSLFLNPALDGGGRVPAQVLLGLASQESNMWQAARTAVPGVTANPLIGNYYGINLYDADTGNDWDVDWSKADCGYGITQVTDHMRMAGREDGHGGAAWPYDTQRAVALDYATNVAAGLQILAGKWNETRAAGMKLNDGAPSRIENWYYALWAYNSGFHPQSEADANSGAWGLGWFNNPANPEWDAGRLPFMENASGGDDATAAAHPQLWPYPEKVLGFAAHPPAYLESPGKMVAGFRAAWWNGTTAGVNVAGSALNNRARVKPPEDMFCDFSNNCFPNLISDSASNTTNTTGPCGRVDFKCWWNKSAVWKTDCSYSCGNEFLRFNNTYPEEADGTAYPPRCGDSGLPANALIVDDVPTNVPSIRPDCPKYWDSQGTFTFTFSNNGTETAYPGKVDTHQLGAGLGGHFYFSHTRRDDPMGQRLKVTGTWKLGPAIEKEARVWVHLPDHGAQTKEARYEIKTASGWVLRVMSQPGDGNRWVSLGAYKFNGIAPEVRLSTITANGTGDEDIAWDAVAFEPGDFTHMPEISMPDPDPNVPEPDFENQVPRIDPNGMTSFLTPQRKQCGPKSARGVQECVTVRPMTEQDQARLGAQGNRAVATAPYLQAWCDPTKVSGYARTRLGSCNVATVLAEFSVNGSPIGVAEFAMVHEYQTKSKSKYFTEMLSLQAINIPPSLGAVTLKDWTSDCAPYCDTSPASWDMVTAWAPGDTHMAQGVRSHTWTNTKLGDWNNIDIYSSLDFTAATVPNGQVVKKAMWHHLGEIRCDSLFPKNSEGCVFPKYTPTLSIPTKKYPAAAAYYWLIREKLAGHPGSTKYNKPLHKEGVDTVADRNRAVVCELGGAGIALKGNTHPLATPDTKGVQCDEYPFATTKESGGQSLDNGTTYGSECANLYAKKEANGSWHLYNDERFSIPSWNEVCARASMAGAQNEGAGATVSGFVTSLRMHDNDPYFVEFPELEGCDPNLYCTIS